jgi:hypothetical protein
MRVLVDYDNVPEHVLRQGPLYLADRLFELVRSHFLDDTHLGLRFLSRVRLERCCPTWDSLSTTSRRSYLLSRLLLTRRLPIFEKAIQSFQRSTQVKTGAFRLRLSVNAKQFFDEIFPDMKRAGIQEESRGSYTKCLEIVSERRSRR